MIILDRINRESFKRPGKIQAKSVSPKATREALGLSDEAQTNVLSFPHEQPAEFMLRQLVISHAVGWACRCVHRRLSILSRLDEQIKMRGEKDGQGIMCRWTWSSLQKNLRRKCMDSLFAYMQASSGPPPAKFITHPLNYCYHVGSNKSYQSSRSWRGMRAVGICLVARGPHKIAAGEKVRDYRFSTVRSAENKKLGGTWDSLNKNQEKNKMRLNPFKKASTVNLQASTASEQTVGFDLKYGFIISPFNSSAETIYSQR